MLPMHALRQELLIRSDTAQRLLGRLGQQTLAAHFAQ